MPRQGSSLLKLLKLGAAALKPTKLPDGTWQQAVVSAKAAARLRKAALLEGKCVPRAEICGLRARRVADGQPLPLSRPFRAWPYEEPRERSEIYQRPPKGHKVDIQAPERVARVQARAWHRGDVTCAPGRRACPPLTLRRGSVAFCRRAWPSRRSCSRRTPRREPARQARSR